MIKGRGKGRGNFNRAYGQGSAPSLSSAPIILIGTQLERFIQGSSFIGFLQHPGALRLPNRSVVMIVESFLLQLSSYESGHPPLRKGKGGHLPRESLEYSPAGWMTTKDEVAEWLTEWAKAQPIEERVPGVSPALHYLVQVRIQVCHHKGVQQGAYLWGLFWSGVFRMAVVKCQGSLIPLLRVADQHMDIAKSLPDIPDESRQALDNYKGKSGLPWGKGKSHISAGEPLRTWMLHRTREVAKWNASHELYEAAFLEAASLANCSTPGLSWCELSRDTLLQLLSMKVMYPHGRKHVLKQWLMSEGTGMQDRRGAVSRLVRLFRGVAEMGAILKYPLSSRRSPAYLRNVLSAEEAAAKIASAVDELVHEDGLQL